MYIYIYIYIYICKQKCFVCLCNVSCCSLYSLILIGLIVMRNHMCTLLLSGRWSSFLLDSVLHKYRHTHNKGNLTIPTRSLLLLHAIWTGVYIQTYIKQIYIYTHKAPSLYLSLYIYIFTSYGLRLVYARFCGNVLCM